MIKKYGIELILDLHKCDPTTFTRENIKKYFTQLCELIDMQREDLHFWDYDGDPEGYAEAPDHLKGTSAVQFIKTSNTTIHTLDKLRKVFLNIFSCKKFNTRVVTYFTVEWFGGKVMNSTVVERI
jgi:S-adenosylmethionine/arginine decarboxylase-like enzyme